MDQLARRIDDMEDKIDVMLGQKRQLEQLLSRFTPQIEDVELREDFARYLNSDLACEESLDLVSHTLVKSSRILPESEPTQQPEKYLKITESFSTYFKVPNFLMADAVSWEQLQKNPFLETMDIQSKSLTRWYLERTNGAKLEVNAVNCHSYPTKIEVVTQPK